MAMSNSKEKYFITLCAWGYELWYIHHLKNKLLTLNEFLSDSKIQTHFLIEEMMLLANKAAARELS